MKKYRACFLSIIILYCYIGLPIYSQNKDTLCIHGDFVCTIGKYLVYCQNSDDTEAIERKLQRLDIRNYRNHSYCIDSTMTSNCLKISDSALIYAKVGILYFGMFLKMQNIFIGIQSRIYPL